MPNASQPSTDMMTLTVAELEADPHGVFRRHRRATPVIRREDSGVIVLRAPDVEQLARDARARPAGTNFPVMRGVTGGALFELFELSMVTTQGIDHRRRRSPFTRAFAAQMIAALRPIIQQEAGALIDGWQGDDTVDLVERYTALIPARVISAILGLRRSDIPHFTQLVYSVSRFLSFTYAPEDLQTIKDDAEALNAYVDEALAARRSDAGSTTLWDFVADAAAKGDLSQREMLVQIVTLIIAGTDTTRVAMASQTSLLLQHRAQWDAICANPSLVHAAVAEAMRFEPSVGSVGRIAAEPIELDGYLIPKGEFITLSTMSAMRDETVYDEPDAFDIHRTDQCRPHLVFGAGSHRCLGEALAWAELEEGLAALSRRLPDLRLAGQPTVLKGHFAIRRIGTMAVTW